MVAGRARAVVVGVGPNTAMGSIRDSMLRTEDVSNEFLSQISAFPVIIISLLHAMFVCWHSDNILDLNL